MKLAALEEGRRLRLKNEWQLVRLQIAEVS